MDRCDRCVWTGVTGTVVYPGVSHLVEGAVGLQLLVVGELDEHGNVPHLRRDGRVVVHHGNGGLLGAQLQEGLVLPLQHQDVGDLAEGQAQGDDLGLRHLAGELADVEHAGRGALGSLLHPQLLAVAAVGWEEEGHSR